MLFRSSARELVEVAREAAAICRQRDALLLVNDRPDVARAAGADGAHLGQDDLPPAAAREVLGADAVIGVSTHSDAEIDAALAAGADYIGFGPVFAVPPHPAYIGWTGLLGCVVVGVLAGVLSALLTAAV